MGLHCTSSVLYYSFFARKNPNRKRLGIYFEFVYGGRCGIRTYDPLRVKQML